MNHLWAMLALSSRTLLGQASQPASGPAPTSLEMLFRSPFIPVIGMMLIFWFFMMRGNKREQRKYQDMLANMKRNDRIQTIGGVLGTVVDVKGDEIVVKVDEANNVKMRFVRSAIKHVFAESAPAKDEKK